MTYRVYIGAQYVLSSDSKPSLIWIADIGHYRKGTYEEFMGAVLVGYQVHDIKRFEDFPVAESRKP